MLAETQTYLERLQDRRTELLKTLDGMDAEGLNWRPLPEHTNSLASLATHALGSERQWIHQIVGGRQIERNRKAEFTARVEEIAPLQAQYAAVALETQNILAALDAEGLDAERTTGQGPHSARWCILHSLEHYTEHLAQMAMTRQLYENRSARPHEI